MKKFTSIVLALVMALTCLMITPITALADGHPGMVPKKITDQNGKTIVDFSKYTETSGKTPNGDDCLNGNLNGTVIDTGDVKNIATYALEQIDDYTDIIRAIGIMNQRGEEYRILTYLISGTAITNWNITHKDSKGNTLFTETVHREDEDVDYNSTSLASRSVGTYKKSSSNGTVMRATMSCEHYYDQNNNYFTVKITYGNNTSTVYKVDYYPESDNLSQMTATKYNGNTQVSSTTYDIRSIDVVGDHISGYVKDRTNSTEKFNYGYFNKDESNIRPYVTKHTLSSAESFTFAVKPIDSYNTQFTMNHTKNGSTTKYTIHFWELGC